MRGRCRSIASRSPTRASRPPGCRRGEPLLCCFLWRPAGAVARGKADAATRAITPPPSRLTHTMTARALDEVIAIKYVAVSVVKDSDGAGVFSFVFHLRTPAGAVFSLSARYSVLRRLSFVIATEGLDAILMS